jgi:hypothetical protein
MLPAGSTDAHPSLRAKHELAAILSQVEERIVTSDYKIRYQRKSYQIVRGDIRPGLRGGRVRVEQRLDGSITVKFRQQRLGVAECQAQPKTSSPRKSASAPRLRPKVVHNRTFLFCLDRPAMQTSMESAVRPGPEGADRE